MATIVTLRLAAAETALGTACDRVPSLTGELEQSAVTDGPDLWLGGADRSAIEAALEADPAVDAYAMIVADGDRWLYDLDADVTDLLDPFLEEDATVLSAGLRSGTWTLRARVTDRDASRRLYDRLERGPATVDIASIHEVTDDPASRMGLTPAQYEALVAAIEHGYFEIPRGISMQELADVIGVSHQALSERLRRAYASIVTTELDLPADADAEHAVVAP